MSFRKHASGGKRDAAEGPIVSRRVCPVCFGRKSFYVSMCCKCRMRTSPSEHSAICPQCGARKSANSKACQSCHSAAREAARPVATCLTCGVQFTRHKAAQSVFCSLSCMSADYKVRMRGAANPNFSDAQKYYECAFCSRSFRSYSNERFYCSRACRERGETVRRVARKDKNHDELVAVFRRLGCVVLELHQAGSGVPDLLVKCHGLWRPVEVKNPAGSYGRRGLSNSQKKFEQEFDYQIPIVRSTDDVLKLHTSWVSTAEEAIAQVFR